MNRETRDPNDPIEAELDRALARLPERAAPAALRGRLEALVAPAPRRRERPRSAMFAASFVSACAAAALVLVATRVPRPGPSGQASSDAAADLVTEAVNDHIRVTSSTHPVDIESGGIHQVKPWFTGRLDFAPRVAFSGDADFPLAGGSLGYFRDRKAAVFVFHRRLHTITLLVLPAYGLGWPDKGPTRVGRLSLSETSSRGFSVLLWREADLGYALISDVNVHDLETLAGKINGD